MDNLESQTYEVFEKDPIKYSQYQQVSELNVRIECQISFKCFGYHRRNSLKFA